MVPLSYLHFPLLKLPCHKLKEKVIIKLVRMDTYIDFNDSYIFLTATYIFFHIIAKISLFRQSHPRQILAISSSYFPLKNLCKIIAHKKSSRYDQNTRKRLQGVQDINTHK